MDECKLKAMEMYKKELSVLLSRLDDNYCNSDDEYENELFYSGLRSAKEFCFNLELIIKRRGECCDII